MKEKLCEIFNKIIAPVKANLKVITISVLSTLAVIVIIHCGEAYISTNSFCTGCHSMTFVEEELKQSVHYGRVGIDPKCADCHLPPTFMKRLLFHMVSGPRDLMGSLKYDMSTIEKFDERRSEMAHTARMTLKKWDSAPCRSCHVSPRPTSEMGKMMHKLMDDGKATCIDCHQNIAHKAVPIEKLNIK